MFIPYLKVRIGAISLFDPELTVIGPVAYYLLDSLGSTFLIIYSISLSNFTWCYLCTFWIYDV